MTQAPQLRPLGAALGSEALGIDLSKPLEDGIFAWIQGVFAEHPVLVFRDQDLSAAELAAFGRRFGTPRRHALIVQNAVAHNGGLGTNWKTRRVFWADRASHEATLRTNLLSLDATRTRHVGNDPNPEKYDPDLWTDEYAFLSKPGEANIQSDLFYDYRTNVDASPTWQAWMQKTQPRLLVLWGKYDVSFELTEPEAYRRDVPKAQVHVLDAGHFALDTAAEEIADLVRRFVSNAPDP